MIAVAALILVAAVVGLFALVAQMLRERAARRALLEAANDYSVNFGLMTPFEIRRWLADRARPSRRIR